MSDAGSGAFSHALIVGAGPGLSASIARLFVSKGLTVSLAARSPEKLSDLAKTLGAEAYGCDVADRGSVSALFEALDASPAGAPDVVIHNPSARVRGPFVDLDPDAVERAVATTALGAFHVAQEAARRMLPPGEGPGEGPGEEPGEGRGEGRGRGAILFTGASASVKGYPQSAAFAMGKFAQRGLAQSLARELHPRGVHIGHINIDGAIRSEARGRVDAPGEPDRFLDPDAIARTYWHILEQDRSAWAWEIDLRPWVERF
ncbi:MAG: SDR family NAD(P)-dependent oxidoreductase [Pseudomonadota bacterium]